MCGGGGWAAALLLQVLAHLCRVMHEVFRTHCRHHTSRSGQLGVRGESGQGEQTGGGRAHLHQLLMPLISKMETHVHPSPQDSVGKIQYHE